MTSIVDQAARDRITTTRADRSGLDANLFVEAGAGAGKTTNLARRIVALVDAGVPIDEIAAITFTEKAAAELRHKVRHQLTLAAAAADEPHRLRYGNALDRLDHAPIGTLHAFARRILNEFPIEAGLPPGFSGLDELDSSLAFEQRWEDLIDRLLADANPAGGALAGGSQFVQLCKFDGFGITKGLRRVANDFHANWDLVEERVVLDEPPVWQLDQAAVAALARDVIALAQTPCPDGDSQATFLAELATLATQIGYQTALGAQLGLLRTLADKAERPHRKGNKQSWKKFTSEADLEALRADEASLGARALHLVKGAIEHRRLLVGAIVGAWVLESARERARDGTVEFHDLLVLARRLLAQHVEARRDLHRRFTKVLLDEFQDTDPIQLAIARRLTANPDDPAHHGDGDDLVPLPGRLFIVGDPKQSIYRFRRADIAQYLRAADQLGSEQVSLTANFRSSRPVIDWVNHVFGQAIEFQPDTQPRYNPLTWARDTPRGIGSRDGDEVTWCSDDTAAATAEGVGSVTVLGADAHTDIGAERGAAQEIRRREAADLVATVQHALTQGWLVGDTAIDDDGQRQPILRPCRPGDITILLPARTTLPTLEAALRAVELPYRAENSSIVYVTTEIRHLMLALRAADDHSDELALVAALRTPLYGCSDVDLYEWHTAGGRWTIWAPVPDAIDASHRVAVALAHLASVARRVTTTAPADLLAAIVDERRLLDAALDSLDARDVWRRVRYVVEQARAWSDAGGHGIRRYLAWVRLQATEARAADTILPEHDHDAVRVMTIHAAKGLEFPITVVAGLSTQLRGASGHQVIWHNGTWGLAEANDALFDDFIPVDEQMGDAERRRMLYVACTRAVDHLVVSVHRKDREPKSEAKMTSGEVLVNFGATDHRFASRLPHLTAAGPKPVAEPIALEWDDPIEWGAARSQALRDATRVASISPTTLAAAAFPDHDPAPPTSGDTATAIAVADDDAGLDKEPVDIDLPPWQRGRYGSAIGRAVHAVLQYSDLATGADIDRRAAAQCAAEGILGMDATVASLARSALDAPIVRAAATGVHHRELFVAADVGGKVLEGYIDLLVDTAQGWVIVDYKTDRWPDDANRAERVARYRLQLAAYAVALERITGIVAVGGTLVRCRPGAPAEQIEIPDWSDALAAVATQLGVSNPRG